MRPPLPPEETALPGARRVLAVAPHYDDEVLGCGGLLARLAAEGARVRVLFLTDGAGGGPAEAAADEARTRSARSARRRAESAGALEALGLSGPSGSTEAEHLELPDGRLAAHLEEAAEAIRRALLDLEPDLLLVPSPLEVTADHRAAFAAVHRVLGALRPGREGGREGAEDPLSRVAAGLEVLLYEVNHPAYPDLLVDVSREIPRIEAAMACYESQQERHDYLAAGLGLRAFRTLSLPVAGAGPAGPVRAAEGYRRLRPADLATRGPAALIRHLGGVPELLEVEEGPPVSVVVRTKDRPGLLGEALASLAEGTYRRVEVVLVNDGGRPPEVPEGYPFPVRRVDLPETRGRAAAANAGVEAATGDWIAFLDDDDLAEPEHLAVLAGAVSGGGGLRAVYSDAAVVTYELAADASPGAPGGWREVERRLPYSRDFDPDLLLLDNYIPFNTVLLERGLFREVAEGDRPPFDPELPIFEDWDLLIRLSRLVPLHHLRRVTCEYRHFRGAGHQHALGERPRERADFLEVKARVLAKHSGALGPDLLARAVDALRAEAVGLAEAAARAREEAAGDRRAREGAEERYHQLHGEVTSLRGERERLAADLGRTEEELRFSGEELRRLHRREEELVGAVEEQTQHIARTYAEIERLNGLLRELRGSSLPGLVRWWRDERRKE